jgi:hypothetical protein
MNPIKFACILACICTLSQPISAQDKLNIKFGKVAIADFDLSKYKIDSSASAVVIADIGYSSFEPNNKSGFSLSFNHFKRIKIIDKKGFNAATVAIALYSDGKDVEKITTLKAVTYNIENGKVVETKLDDKSVFTDNVQKNVVLKKFTFPAVKEGSIIEFTYTQSSDFLFELQPWEFQDQYPHLWSEYEVAIPEYFSYVFLSQGYNPFFIKTSKNSSVHFDIRIQNTGGRTEMLPLDAITTVSRWVMKDVPALKEEKFTTTLANHISKIEFQLSQIHYPNTAPEDIMGTWVKVSERMMENEKFGVDINRSNGWLDDDLKTITKGAANTIEKAQKIYAYVRDNFTCSEHGRVYMTTNIKTVFKNKSGNEAELNLLLCAMLNHEKIKANPVILSTRTHGITHQMYPLMDRFNYVICATALDNSIYYLDASCPRLGFAYLPDYCYNGHARLISVSEPADIFLQADSVKETKLTSVIIINNEKTKSLDGSLQSTMGNFESYNLREKISKKSEKEFFKDIQSSYGNETEIENGGIDSLKLFEYPVTVHYDFKIKTGGEDIVYFTPLLGEAYKDNPFKSAERKYPVEMPYTTDETYVLNMEIPTGYVVDELPKSAKVAYNETDGFFEYLIVKDDSNIQLRSRVKINRANFFPDDYATLRDFFAFIVKKQSEQIVFKKKK